MIRDLVRQHIATALLNLGNQGFALLHDLPPIEVADPRQPEHGDYACNIAMVLAKPMGSNPRVLGEALAKELSNVPAFESVEVAGPGFLNFRIATPVIAEFVGKALAAGTDLPRSIYPNPQKINVEFVSVNPNGPITVGSGRGAAFGSALCKVLDAAGHTVHREYYINDGVNSEQMRLFGLSVRALALGDPIPEKGYKGDYVQEAAQEVVRLVESGLEGRISQITSLLSEDETGVHVERKGMLALLQARLRFFSDLQHRRSAEPDLRRFLESLDVVDWQRLSEDRMLARQENDLDSFGVEFDTWFSEQSLHDHGEVEACIDDLRNRRVADEEPYQTVLKLGKKGEILESERVEQTTDPIDEDDPNSDDGASVEATLPTLWLRSTHFGDDKDRVLRRRDGRLTYIASDVAYHKDKFNRPPQADKLITILGPDHHGYIGRLTAVVAALLRKQEAADADRQALAEARKRLQVVIFQIVRFVKDGQPAPMRKRDGNIYALIDLIDELGKTMAPEEPTAKQRAIGRDVARFFYLTRSHDTHLDFDIDLATKKSDENPVFYVQYAHARICSVLRKAEEMGLTAVSETSTLALLSHPKELALVKKVVDLPYEVRRCADDFGVHRLTTYAAELARAYHGFYDNCRVLQPEQKELSQARLALCQAAALGLRGVLDLLGVSAPERM